MNPVATINGAGVYSNKCVSSIHNTKVTFSDGSWCDVATKQVVSNGSGYISIGSPQPGSSGIKPKKIGPEVFTGRAVSVSGVRADVDITVGKELSITVEGPEAEVDAIKFAQRGDQLVVESKNVGSGGGHSGISITTNAGSRGIFVSGGSMSIVSMSSGRGGPASTKISITVPRGALVIAQDIHGQTTIGDTEGPVQASVLGSGDFKIGKIGDGTFTVQGSGNVDVDEVSGSLTVNVQGSGDVRVRNGNVRNLMANVMGSGDVKFDGKAEYASLTIMGSGDIDVAHVTNRPQTQVMGSGDINVRNW